MNPKSIFFLAVSTGLWFNFFLSLNGELLKAWHIIDLIYTHVNHHKITFPRMFFFVIIHEMYVYRKVNLLKKDELEWQKHIVFTFLDIIKRNVRV